MIANRERFVEQRKLEQESSNKKGDVMKLFRTSGIAFVVLLACAGIASAQETSDVTPAFKAGTWARVVGAPAAGIGHMMLLTDGSVLMQSAACNPTGNWYRLIPDKTGNYAKGTFVTAGTMPAGYNPLYFASAVLPTGQVIVMGGEYDGCNAVWTNKGAIYNPKTNKWTAVKAPVGWQSIGDAQSVVLPNGKFMMANCCTTDQAILTKVSPATWTPTGAGKADINDEEGWTLLPSGNILTVDANNPTDLTSSEIYNTATGTWSNAGSTIVKLEDTNPDNSGSHELGPAVLRPDGTVFYGGATVNNAIYNSVTGVWTKGPKFGLGLDMADAPAALLPSGNVLLDTSPGVFNNGSKFFEWDGTKMNATTGPPNAKIDSSYAGNMLILPTGQVIFADFSSDVEIYTPSGTYQAAWQPVITSVQSTLTHGTNNHAIKGTQLNGLSQGTAYGDDNQQATNYPIVRITDAAGNVVYCKTHTFSSMGVATGSKVVTAQFDVPATGIATGPASLVVVANGIPSAAVAVTIN